MSDKTKTILYYFQTWYIRT